MNPDLVALTALLDRTVSALEEAQRQIRVMNLALAALALRVDRLAGQPESPELVAMVVQGMADRKAGKL